MSTVEDFQEYIPLIEDHLHYTFQDKALIELAFTHCSFANENRDVVPGYNERLEFLGDAVLGLVISEFLYAHLPNHPEGELSYLRSRLVESAACVLYLQTIQVADFLRVGKGEAMNAGKGRETVSADLFEAIMGAIYLDGGWEAARQFFFKHFKQQALQIIQKPHRNWKAELQDFCQKKAQTPPDYSLERTEGPDHLKTFFVTVQLQGSVLGEGQGTSKKEAEQQAAENAMRHLES